MYKRFKRPQLAALTIQAINPGIGFNDVQVLFTDSGAVTGNDAEATYDAMPKTLTIDIGTTATTANSVVTELLERPLFSAQLEYDSNQQRNGSDWICRFVRNSIGRYR